MQHQLRIVLAFARQETDQSHLRAHFQFCRGFRDVIQRQRLDFAFDIALHTSMYLPRGMIQPEIQHCDPRRCVTQWGDFRNLAA